VNGHAAAIILRLAFAIDRDQAVHIAGEALRAGCTLDEHDRALRCWDELQARSVHRVGGGAA
jgi:hypothetical protein